MVNPQPQPFRHDVYKRAVHQDGMPRKTCDIADGTYRGAVASLTVAGSKLAFTPEGNAAPLSFDWKCSAGTFLDPDGRGTAVVEREPSASDPSVTLVRITVRPGKRDDRFPCVFETGFWFYDGKYDGGANGLKCSGKKAAEEVSNIVGIYKKMGAKKARFDLSKVDFTCCPGRPRSSGRG